MRVQNFIVQSKNKKVHCRYLYYIFNNFTVSSKILNHFSNVSFKKKKILLLNLNINYQKKVVVHKNHRLSQKSGRASKKEKINKWIYLRSIEFSAISCNKSYIYTRWVIFTSVNLLSYTYHMCQSLLLFEV